MRCPTCSSEFSADQGFCPHCGTPTNTRRSLGARVPALVIVTSIAILGCFVAVGIYTLQKSGLFDRLRAISARRHQPAGEVPVEHGPVVQAKELHGQGKLYFLPMGRQVIPAQSLADYYHEKFAIDITVLPELSIEAGDCAPQRHQCIAEEMILHARREHPEIVNDPDSVLIILTDEDIYPRSLDWNFTYSFHSGYRFGIVSTRRMDPDYSHDAPDPVKMLAATRQMLTKYIGLMYFHLPTSHDPTSVMYQPLTPDGRSDDLYESDLHSEESANGMRSGWPCLSFTYSYATGEMRPLAPSATECDFLAAPRSPDEETFQIELGGGQLVDRNLDFVLDSNPPVAFRRAYVSGYLHALALGIGTTHSYNSWLYSDGAAKLSFMDIVHEDGGRDHLKRLTPGRGFSANVVFEGDDDGTEFYGSRMTWDSGHFKLQLRDGSWSTYLPCADGRCYWIGYQDAKGNALKFDRGAQLDLQQLSTQDGQGITFQSDAQQRITHAVDTAGHQVSYDYDSEGCLVRVRRAEGQITEYSYDSGHHLIEVAVTPALGGAKRTILSFEYENSGRVSRLSLPDGTSYELSYNAIVEGVAHQLALKEPSGRVVNYRWTGNEFTASATPVRYLAKQ